MGQNTGPDYYRRYPVIIGHNFAVYRQPAPSVRGTFFSKLRRCNDARANYDETPQSFRRSHRKRCFAKSPSGPRALSALNNADYEH